MKRDFTNERIRSELRRKHVLKKHISLILVMTLLLTAVLSFGGVALAASELSVSPKTSEMASGGNVDFDYYVYNEGGDTIEGAIVCTTTGATVVNLVSVGPGGTSEGTFTMNVPDNQLGQNLAFSFNNGALTDSAKINKKNLTTKLAASGITQYTLYGEGETVKFEFKVENQGETTAEGIVVKAPELNSGKALNEPFSLSPGQSKTVKYSHTMTKDVTVNAAVSFSVGGAAQSPVGVNPITLTKESREVKTELTVSNDKPAAGEEVTFTLKLTNKGNVPYTDIQVLVNGEEKDYPSKLEGNSEITGDFKMSFQTPTDVSCSISLKDHTGTIKNISSNTVSIDLPVDPNAVASKLQFTMNVDRPQLTSAGSINFTGVITNGTDYELSNIKVDEATLGNIFSASTLAAGGKANVPFSTDINETTTYSFVLTATDKDGNPYTVNAEPITVTIQAAGAEETPGFEDAADVTETPLTLDNNASLGSIGTLGIIAIVLVVLIIGVGIALLVLWKKGQSPRKSTTPPGRKKPASSYTRKKPPAQKNYRDRNNF
jgi:hypothetical protein